MARTKKRGKMWNSSGSSSKKSKKKSGSSAGSSGVDEAKVEKLFAELADEDDTEAAGMEGIVKLCEHLDLDPFEDIRVLVLLWKLGSKEKPAQISKEEFIEGCCKLHVDSIEKFQALIPSLDTGFLDETEFKDFYKVRALRASVVAWLSTFVTHLTLDSFYCIFHYFLIVATVLLPVQPARNAPHSGQGTCNCIAHDGLEGTHPGGPS